MDGCPSDFRTGWIGGYRPDRDSQAPLVAALDRHVSDSGDQVMRPEPIWGIRETLCTGRIRVIAEHARRACPFVQVPCPTSGKPLAN